MRRARAYIKVRPTALRARNALIFPTFYYAHSNGRRSRPNCRLWTLIRGSCPRCIEAVDARAYAGEGTDRDGAVRT